MSTGVAWVRRAALLAVLCFLSMLGYTLYSLNNLQNELAEDVGENMVWALSQGVYQSGRLHLAHEMSGADFMIQRSLLKSRLSMLSEGGQRRYMERSGVWPDVQRASRLLAAPTPDYAALQGLLRDVGNRVMLAERMDAGLRREAHNRLILQLMGAVLGILFFGTVLCWQLFVSLKRAKAATEQIARQHAEARQLLDALELERSARLRYRDFVSLMSHQLRTPLAVIDSSAQRLVRQLQGPGSEQNVNQRSERIRRSVRQLNQLISRVLEGLRVDEISSGGLSSLDIVRCSWQQLVDETLERLGDSLDGRRLDVRWAEAGAELIWLECDRMWCMEILGNLISNAHKYSPLGLPIEVLTRVEAGELRCRVRDFGPGIAPSDAPRLFERFYRSPGSQHVSGMGLGLPIARTLAQWQGGSLSVDNPPGGGAAFTFSLPLERAAASLADALD